MASEARETGAEVIGFSGADPLLTRLRQEAEAIVRQEPELGGFVHPAILAQESLAGLQGRQRDVLVGLVRQGQQIQVTLGG